MSNFKIFRASIYQIKVLKHVGEISEKKKNFISIGTQTEYQEPDQKIDQKIDDKPDNKIDNKIDDKIVHKQYDKLLYLSYSTIILLNIYTLSKVYYIDNNHNKSIKQNPLILTMNFIYKLFKNF